MISICVPTCRRPALLKLALASIFIQEYRPLEVLIGDDSGDSDTEDMLENMPHPHGIVLRYYRNPTPLGQAENINMLFDRARGERVVLLHDDDLFCPGGLDLLDRAWRSSSRTKCSYGLQMVVDPDGRLLEPESVDWNTRYFRTRDHAGPQSSALVAALWQQVPNNCYLFETAAARNTRYRPEVEVGQCVDAEFVIRLSLGAAPNSFFMIDEPISNYRLTPNSIARSKDINRRQDLLFEIVDQIDGNAAVQAAKFNLLYRIGVGASLDAAMAGRPVLALRIVLSKFYARPMISRWTAYRITCMLSPRLGRAIKRRLDRVGPR